MSRCSNGQMILNMWLAGCSYQDVLRTQSYRSLRDDSKIQIGEMWKSLDVAFMVVCAATATGPEQIYSIKWQAERAAKRGAR